MDNETKNAGERQRLHCHGYGDCEPLELDETEATCQWFDETSSYGTGFEEDDPRWNLRDDGRSDGQGESYSERNH